MTTPTRTELEAAALIRQMREALEAAQAAWGQPEFPSALVDTAIAAAMGWPTVPPAPTPKEPTP